MNIIAVDVGTTSVRLAIVSFRGEQAQEVSVLASHTKDISLSQSGNRFEQSSAEVWKAICDCCNECLNKSSVRGDTIKSLAFSATCSLVIEDASQTSRDIIMWMDHRATKEANTITRSGTKVVSQFGGVCSPEFSISKLHWLKSNQPELFKSAEGFYELPDWLVHKCLGAPSASSPRSLCCVTCKWGYDAHAKCHCDCIKTLGCGFEDQLGQIVKGPGAVAGYLCAEAAADLGLIGSAQSNGGRDKENFKPPKITVATSMIDAHAGTLAMLSVSPESYGCSEMKIDSTFCSLAGTSSCHMILSPTREFTAGIWGPYKDVVVEGYYLIEAGQSMTGKLIEMCIESHKEGRERLTRGERLYQIIASLNEQVASTSILREMDLHVLPTYHGSRSPLANPRLKGGLYGLSSKGPNCLLEHYVATVQSLVFELRLIVEALGKKLSTLLVSGGLMKNKYFMQTLADVLRCRVVKMSLADIDFMVMGSALVARHAALTRDPDRPLTTDSIKGIKYHQLEILSYEPRNDQNPLLEKRYRCYKEFVTLSQRIDEIMNGLSEKA